MRTSIPAFRSPRVARLSPLAAGIAVALAPVPALATTYPVSNTAELITAINTANSLCATDTTPLIQASGPFVVSASTGMPPFGLPTLFCATNAFDPKIDGGGVVSSSDTDGFATGMEINGSGSFADCGLTFPTGTYGGHLTVTGTKISNFTYGALFGNLTAGVCGNIELHNNLLIGNTVGARSNDPNSILGDSGGGGNVVLANKYGFWLSAASTIQNNYIGTPDGSTANGNTYGIYIDSSNGPTIDNNRISGNTTAGVYFSNDFGGTTLSNNYIGTTADGDGALANGDGVVMSSSGNQSLDNNVISGNSGAGVALDNTSFVTFDSNLIGVGFSGSPLANNRGVDAFCSGYIDLFDNTISSNIGDGLLFTGTDGSQLSGNTVMSNGGNGIRFASPAPTSGCFNYGSFNSLFGNDIELNGANGILLTGLGTNNQFSYGTISANGIKNISLNGGGATLPNDPGDGDAGPNNQQNWPDLTSVVQGAGTTTIGFTLDASAASQYQVDFYSNSAMGKPGGELYLGSAFVYGATPSTFVYSGGAVSNISATATLPSCCSSGGDTSEFSPMKAAITAPTALITPTRTDFGSIEVGKTSAPTSFNVRSIGDQPYVISDILPGSFCLGDQTISAAAALPSFCYGGGFTCSTTCQLDTPYSKNQSCTFTAQFSPIFFGLQSDSICIQDNTSASPHFIDLQGTGTPPPLLVIDPVTLDFGDVPVGATTDSMRFHVTSNMYGVLSSVTVAASSGEFNIVGDTCSPSIPARGNCDIDVAFSPTVSGAQSGFLVVQGMNIASDKPIAPLIIGTPASVSAQLSGNGISGGQLVLPESIDMGAAQVGGAAVSYPVELRNTGYGTLTLSSFTASSPFTLVNGCPATLEPQQACTITLQFAATALGEVHGTLTVVTSAEGGSREIPVTARGQTIAAPLLRLQPAALGFGARVIGSSSTPQEITIQNIGGATAQIALSSATIDFLIGGNSCGGSLQPQASCTASVTFRPLGFGTRVGQFTVTSNANNSPATVGLAGTGCRPFAAGSSRFGSSISCAP